MVRRIQPPSPELKNQLRNLAESLYSAYEQLGIPNSVHGYVKGRSNITNALCHINSQWVYNIDIKDFFESITVGKFIQNSELYDRQRNQVGPAPVEIIMPQGFLPVGYNTSPILSNLLMRNFDLSMETQTTPDIVYTRYSDNITVSGYNEESVDRVGNYIKNRLIFMGFNINRKKTYKQRSNCNSITGITPTGPNRRVREKLGAAIHQQNQSSIRGFNSYLNHTQQLIEIERLING